METVSLAKLDLSNTKLNSVKATTIISALKNNSSLKVFNISHNDIDDGAADSITAVISNNSKIEIVNLSHNKLSYNGVLKVVSLLPKGITTIDISGNLVACDNIADLATALSNCPVLQQLSISENLLSLTNGLTIAQYFRNHLTLQSLDLSGNSVSFSSACEFIIGIILSVNEKLVNINVCGKNITPDVLIICLLPKMILISIHLCFRTVFRHIALHLIFKLVSLKLLKLVLFLIMI